MANFKPGDVGHLAEHDRISTQLLALPDRMDAVLADPTSAASTRLSTTIATLPIHQVTDASYTLILADAGLELETLSSDAVTIIVPPDSDVAYPVGTMLTVRQYGAGAVTLTYGAGVTLRAPNGTRTANRHSTMTLVKRAANEWVVGGDAAYANQSPLAPYIGDAPIPYPHAALVNFDPEVGGPGASSFVATSTPDSLAGEGDASPVLVTGLASSTPYTFTVRAENTAGQSSPSEPSAPVSPFGAMAGNTPFGGRIGWLRGDQLSDYVTDGATVFLWPGNDDFGYSGALRRQDFGRPVLAGSGAFTANGLPTVEFDGVDDYLVTPHIYAEAAPLTVMVVARVGGAAGTSRTLLDCGGLAIYASTDDYWKIYAGAQLASTTVADGNFCLITATFNGASSTIRRNGVEIAAGDAGAGSFAGPIILGAGAGGSTRWPGHIAEVLIYQGAIGVPNRDLAEAYLMDKYAL